MVDAVRLLLLRWHLFCLWIAVSRLLLKQFAGCCQLCWGSIMVPCVDEVRCLFWIFVIVLVIRLIECWDLLDLCLDQDLYNNAECSEVRLVRWWTCSGSNRLLLCFEGNTRYWNHRWSFDEVWIWSFVMCWFWHSDLSHRGHCQNVGVWVGPRVSEDLCLDAIGHCECSSILLASRVAKVTLIGNFAA